MKPRATRHIEQYFVAEEVRSGLYRLFTSHDYRPVKGYRYRVTSAAPDIWESVATFGARHRNPEGLITLEQLRQFLDEQRAHCDIEEVPC